MGGDNKKPTIEPYRGVANSMALYTQIFAPFFFFFALSAKFNAYFCLFFIYFLIKLGIKRNGARMLSKLMGHFQLSHANENVRTTVLFLEYRLVKYFRLRWVASVKQEGMRCKAPSVWATKAASSAKLRSRIS